MTEAGVRQRTVRADYASVLKQVAALAKARADYLRANGWEQRTLRGVLRWVKVISWGTSSSKMVEADLGDAVTWQARFDGDID